MTRGWTRKILIGLICLSPLPALADRDGPTWVPEFGMEMGVTFGGGNLVVSGITGQPSLTPPNVSLYAGDTVYMQGYYRQAIGHTGLSLKAAAGGLYVCQVPSCLDVFIDVMSQGDTQIGNYESGSATGDLALEYAWGGEYPHGGRVGIGATFRSYNMLNSYSDVYAFQSVTLKPAHGWFVEYEVGHLGLRYTHIVYHSSVSNYSVNASNIGIYGHMNYKDQDWYPGEYYAEGLGIAKQTLAFVFTPSTWRF